MKIKVNQKDLNGNIINSYESYAHAASVLGCDESTIRRAAKAPNRIVFGKFKFEMDSDTTQLDYVKQDSPRILLLDIETSPTQAFIWKFWKENVNIDQVISDWFMLSWAAKWLGDSKVMSSSVTSIEAISQDDSRLCAELWMLLDAADIVVAHNGNAFDIPKIQSRFLINGFNPPSAYRQIDTLVIAKQQFGFSSNKLDFIARLFNIEGKYKTGFELWSRCYAGDSEALIEMERYNAHDVEILEKVYLKLRPYVKGHPNLNMYNDSSEITCPICNSTHLTLEEDKFFYTQSSKFPLYRCMDCGGLSRGKKSVSNKRYVSAIPK